MGGLIIREVLSNVLLIVSGALHSLHNHFTFIFFNISTDLFTNCVLKTRKSPEIFAQDNTQIDNSITIKFIIYVKGM